MATENAIQHDLVSTVEQKEVEEDTSRPVQGVEEVGGDKVDNKRKLEASDAEVPSEKVQGGEDKPSATNVVNGKAPLCSEEGDGGHGEDGKGEEEPEITGQKQAGSDAKVEDKEVECGDEDGGDRRGEGESQRSDIKLEGSGAKVGDEEVEGGGKEEHGAEDEDQISLKRQGESSAKVGAEIEVGGEDEAKRSGKRQKSLGVKVGDEKVEGEGKEESPSVKSTEDDGAKSGVPKGKEVVGLQALKGEEQENEEEEVVEQASKKPSSKRLKVEERSVASTAARKKKISSAPPLNPHRNKLLEQLQTLDDMRRVLEEHGRSEADFHVGDTIVVEDLMQSDYEYELTAPIGKDFAEGFTPKFSPREMLALGIFDGHAIPDCIFELPKEWYEDALKNETLALGGPDEAKNHFKVKSTHPAKEPRKRGWIPKKDPHGWFQWFCRYYLGRRLEPDDEYQMSRWRQMRKHAGQATASKVK